MHETPPRSLAPMSLVGAIDGRACTFVLWRGTNLVGSLPTCEVFLDLPGISRRHAQIEARARSATLTDLGSKNGTQLNGRSIRSVELRLGDEITLCGLTLRVERLDPQEAQLGIALDGGSSRGAGPLSKTTQLHRDDVGLEQGVVAWVDHLAQLWEWLFQSPDPDIEVWLRRWVGLVAGDGAALIEDRDGERILLASCGPMDGERLSRWETLDDDPAASMAWQTVDASLRLGLVLFGGRAGPLRHHLASLAVRWLAHSRQPGLATTAALAGPPSDFQPQAHDGRRKLVFPAGYVQGESRAMAAVYAQMRHLTQGDVPVLIIGDTGVGKELLARSLHLSSQRCDGPMVTINCAAIPEDLLEAELFGIARGVATGVNARPGRISQADGGTLFLDEIGDMPTSLQAKLLRVLQEKEVQPLGGQLKPVDVRVVSATHNELSTMIEGGVFRRDLYYRLAGYVLRLPSLAERIEDLPLLVEHFLKRFSDEINKPIRGVTVGALRLMAEYPWPGNVRQLEHEVRRLAYLAYPGQAVDSSQLSPEIRSPPMAETAASAAEDKAAPTLPTLDLSQLEVMAITAALAEANGVLTDAGRRLGISRDALRRRLQRHGLR